MWIVFAFISAALLGLYDVSKKTALRNNAVLPVLLCNTWLCALIFVPAVTLSATGFLSAASAVYVPAAPASAHALVLLKAAIVLTSWVCGYFAMKHLPLTIVGPVNATRPVMTLVGALLIYGEALNAWQWAGVMLALLSFLLLSRSSRKEGISFSSNRWVVLLVAAALTGAASGLYDKYLMAAPEAGGAGLDRLFVQSWYNLYQALLMGIVLLTLWWPRRHRGTPFEWRPSILLISLFLTAADLAYFYALSQPGALISVVSMVRRGSVVVSFAFGALLFHEKNLKAKAVDLLLVLAGMACLAVGTLR